MPENPKTSESRRISLGLPAWMASLGGTLLCIGILAITLLALYSLRVSRQLARYEDLKQEIFTQDAHVHDFYSQIKDLENKVGVLTRREQDVTRLLGLPITLPANTKPGAPAVKDFKNLDSWLPSLHESVSDETHKYDLLLSRYHEMKGLMSDIPSIWPTKGNLTSFFGWRTSPWTGMHTGVDIDTIFGAPVKAAASGVVVHAGWSNGFGEAVIIRHEKGFETLYGHNSKLLVTVGQKVQQGHIVALVGSTGFSTGTHLHYEVHRFGQVINPIRFLDLSIPKLSRILSGAQPL